MPKLRGVVAGVAEAAGVGLRSSQHAARLLREDRSGLWPEFGPGRREALVGLDAINNLVLAIGCSLGQLSEGPRWVKEFRSLRVTRVVHRGENAPIPVFLTAGEAIDSMLENLLVPTAAIHPAFQVRLMRPAWRIVLTRPMTAEIAWPADDENRLFDRMIFGLPGMDLPPVNRLFQTEIRIKPEQMEAIAAVCSDAAATAEELQHDISLAPGRVDESEATPETTKAAGPGSHDGLLSGQPAFAQTEPLNTARSIASQGGKQSAPSAIASERQVHRNRLPQGHSQNGWYRTDPAPP